VLVIGEWEQAKSRITIHAFVPYHRLSGFAQASETPVFRERFDEGTDYGVQARITISTFFTIHFTSSAFIRG
jgi:hypothetical protein